MTGQSKGICAKTWFLALFVCWARVFAQDPPPAQPPAGDPAPPTEAAPIPAAEPAPAGAPPAETTPPAEPAPPAEAMPAPAPVPAPETTPPAETPPTESPPAEAMPAENAPAREPIPPAEPMPSESAPIALATYTGVLEYKYPVTSTPTISVSNQFGAIVVKTWPDSVVGITAEVVAKSEDNAYVQEFGKAIEIRVDHTPERLDILTVYPDAGDPPKGKTAGEVTYTIMVPVDSTLLLDNLFHNIYVEGVGGQITIDSQYGDVDLRNLGGTVRVNARGPETKLSAFGLRRGGNFTLLTTKAVFEDVSGNLVVSNDMGSVELRSLGEVVDVDVNCVSAPILFLVPHDAHPDIEVTTQFGAIESEVPLESTKRGDTIYGRLTNVDATQRITLQSTFETVKVKVVEVGVVAEPLLAGSSEPVVREVVDTRPLAAGMPVVIEATVGDIRIVGSDAPEISVKASKRVETADLANVEPALEGLEFRVEEIEGRLHVFTVTQENMEALGAKAYRVDLSIACPRTSPIKATAANGYTYISEMSGMIEVDQARGKVTVTRAGGAVDLSNNSGDIEAIECAGAVAVSCENGTATLENVKGDIEVSNRGGKTVVVSPGAGATIRNTAGDVRIIALEGVFGAINVTANDGNISMAVPDSADAMFILTAHGGTVEPGRFALTGTIEPHLETFQGRLNNFTHRVDLETQRGNIILD